MRKNRHVTKAEVEAIDAAGEAIERATTTEVTSKQPRFMPDSSNMQALFYQIYGWGKELIFNEPKYMADSRARDTWLSQIVMKEPYLLGILNSVVSIDKNRGWTITGGKIQVKRFVGITHNFQAAPDLLGYRPGMSATAQNYYQADLGAVVEIGRQDIGAGAVGPLAALYAVDSTKCKLTGNSITPLQYAPGIMRGGTSYWTNDDYFRVVSLPNPNETVNGLGFCAISRCVELAKIAVSIFEHYKEKLGSKAPKGILTINGGGITQKQWLQSLEESKAELAQLQREYYSGVQVLVADRGSEINVNLVPLSSLPDNFDLQTTINMLIYGYALAFGYDPREFWPVSSGALGTATETQEQHRKATSKGGLDFALGFQEKYQEELPETIQFEFEQRDVEGDIAETAFQKAKFDIIDAMNKSANANGEIMLTHDQIMELLVEANLIPETWTLPEEDVTATDTDDIEQMAEKQRVINAMERYPDDDIVTYNSNTGKYRMIRKAGEKRLFKMRIAKPKYLATAKGVKITESDVTAALEEAGKRLGKKAQKVMTGATVLPQEPKAQ